MIIIAHRCNLEGPDPQYENTIGKMSMCLDLGYSVEIDVWKLPNEDFYRMGHDAPRLNEGIALRFLEDKRIFCHCKNDEAYESLKDNPNVLAFKHEDEMFVKINKNIFSRHCVIEEPTWHHSKNTECLFRENDIYVDVHSKPSDFVLHIEKYSNCGGICTDYSIELQNEYNKYCKAVFEKRYNKFIDDQAKLIAQEIDKEIIEQFKKR